MHLSADHVRSLQPFDLKTLKSVEYLMGRYDWVPQEEIVHNTGFSESETLYRLRRLSKWGMIDKSKDLSYLGYCLLFNGYDTLAISHFTQKKIISALGSMVGEGKEALVYEALAVGPVILKLHRLGQRSFRAARKNRTFMPDGHCPWIIASHYSAEQEYLALSTLHKVMSVPSPIAMNRNVIVMELIAGNTLNAVPVEKPDKIFDKIIDEVRKAYKAGFVHGDLSEYNIMTDGENIWIIDWPQWVPPTHTNADEILYHDIDTVAKFFLRKYQMTFSVEDLIEHVIG